MTDPRVERALRLLESNGLAEASVEVAGFDADIAAVRLPPRLLGRLRVVAHELRDLGFRYVALELDA